MMFLRGLMCAAVFWLVSGRLADHGHLRPRPTTGDTSNNAQKSSEHHSNDGSDARSVFSVWSEQTSIARYLGNLGRTIGSSLLMRYNPLHSGRVFVNPGIDQDDANWDPLERPVGGHEKPKSWSTLLIQSAATLVVLSLVAVVYQRAKKDRVEPVNDGLEHTKQELDKGVWRYGLFDCFGDVPLCMMGCCCPAIRWADTMRMAGLMKFWLAFGIFAGLIAVSELTGGLGGLMLIVVGVIYRQKLRQRFKLEADSGSSYGLDCLAYAFCMCCSVVQEARQMEEAYAVGHPVKAAAEQLDAT